MNEQHHNAELIKIIDRGLRRVPLPFDDNGWVDVNDLVHELSKRKSYTWKQFINERRPTTLDRNRSGKEVLVRRKSPDQRGNIADTSRKPKHDSATGPTLRSIQSELAQTKDEVRALRSAVELIAEREVPEVRRHLEWLVQHLAERTVHF